MCRHVHRHVHRHVNRHMHKTVYRHVHRRVHRRAYRHVCRHACRHAYENVCRHACTRHAAQQEPTSTLVFFLSRHRRRHVYRAGMGVPSAMPRRGMCKARRPTRAYVNAGRCSGTSRPATTHERPTRSPRV